MGNVSVINELSSRPERSGVEEPAVHSTSKEGPLVHSERSRGICSLSTSNQDWSGPDER